MTKIGLILCMVVVAVTAHAQPEKAPAVLPNPFAGFETLLLSNGLKVWYKNLPNDPVDDRTFSGSVTMRNARGRLTRCWNSDPCKNPKKEF